MTRILATVLASTLFALCGCGASDPPAPVGHTSAAPASPTHTGPVEPTMPAAASRQTKAGAVAFARYFWNVVNYAQRSLDTDLLRRLASESCAGCQSGAEWIDHLAAQHGSIRGGENRIRRIAIPSPARPGHPDWNLSVKLFSSAQVVSRPGRAPERYKPGVNRVSMTLRPSNGSWEVAFLEYQ